MASAAGRIAQTAQRCASRRLALLASSAGATVRRGRGWLAVSTGVASNDFDGVVCDAPAEVAVRDALAVVAWFRDLGVPACWLSSAPNLRLTETLIDAGAVPERTGWWVGRPIGNRAGAAESGITIRRVSTEADLESWFDVAAACGWADDPADREARRRLYVDVGLDSHRFGHWIASDGTRAVGMASAFLDETAVDLCSLAVVEEERRRGIGRSLVEHRLQWAARRGATDVVSAVSPDGWKLYSRLGFQSVPVVHDVCFYLPDR